MTNQEHRVPVLRSACDRRQNPFRQTGQRFSARHVQLVWLLQPQAVLRRVPAGDLGLGEALPRTHSEFRKTGVNGDPHPKAVR